jgi:DNA polymerase-3 subunit delta
MAALSFNSLFKSANKGDFAPVTYLTGDEDVLKDQLVDLNIEKALDPSCSDFNLDVRSAADLDAEALIALVDTPPMLAERRVVVVKSLEQWRKNSKQWKALRSYVENPSPTTVLLLLHRAGGSHKDKPDPALGKNSRHGNITKLDSSRLGGWISNRAQIAGITLADDAVAHLGDVVGPNLAQLITEIEKLAACCPNQDAITRTDVANLVGVNHGETISDWVGAIISGNTARAVELLDIVLPQAGVTGVRLVSGLGPVFFGMRIARTYLDNGLTSRQAEGKILALLKKLRPWGIGSWNVEAARWTGAAKIWTGKQIDDAIMVTYETDRALKSTTVTNERGKLTNMLLDFGTKLEEA